jgi:hypothetical protein
MGMEEHCYWSLKMVFLEHTKKCAIISIPLADIGRGCGTR